MRLMNLAAGFEAVLNRYDVPKDFVGRHNTTDFDFFKFAGHELYVDFISTLLGHKRWDRLTEVFEQDYYVPRFLVYRLNPTASFTFLGRHVELLEYRKQRLQLNRLSIHADLLQKLHTEGDLAQTLSPSTGSKMPTFSFSCAPRLIQTLPAHNDLVSIEAHISWIRLRALS